MSILREVLTAYLSGLTTKTGNEIHWKDCAGELTIEPIDISREIYILRRYTSGEFLFEYEYEDDEVRKRTVYRNNIMASRSHYKNGRLHGKHEYWRKDGKLLDSVNYKDGIIYGEGIFDSQEVEYDNGLLVTEYRDDKGIV